MPTVTEPNHQPVYGAHPLADCAVIDHVGSASEISYTIHFGRRVLATIVPGMVSERKTVVVTTPTVFDLYGSLLVEASDGCLSHEDFLVLDCTETTKTMDQVELVCARALSALDRTGLIIGFGGGVVMDIACFAASMIRRGSGYVKVPTTLVGQVDAGIGIKGGVNFRHKKSYLGCFHAPEKVLIQPDLLATLEPSQLSAGMAEMLKMAILFDSSLFDLIEQSGRAFLRSRFQSPAPEVSESIQTSIRLMLKELRQNPTERCRYDRWVDFGHTFSPVLEARTGFSIPHGFAVSIDMALSAALSTELGTLPSGTMHRILRCLHTLGLPIVHDAVTTELCVDGLREARAHRGGSINLVIPTAIGASIFIKSMEEIREDVLLAALARLRDADRERRRSRDPLPSTPFASSHC